MPKKSQIGIDASVSTQNEFAARLSSLTSLTAAEAAALFPTKADRDEMNELLEIVSGSADENVKKAKLVAGINKVGGAVLKIVRKVATG